MNLLFLSFFFLFISKIVLNLFQQAIWAIQFCYELMKIHHQPMTDPAFPSLQFKVWAQAAAAFMSKVRRVTGKSSSTKIKICPLFLQPRVTHQETCSLVTFPREEPFIPSERCVKDPEGRHTLALISSPQTNENQTWSELDLKARGKSDGCLRLIPWTVPFLVCNGDFRRDYSQKSTSSVSLPLSPYGICSLLYQNLWQNAVFGTYLGWVKMWIIYAHCIESLEGGPDNLEVGKTPWWFWCN